MPFFLIATLYNCRPIQNGAAGVLAFISIDLVKSWMLTGHSWWGAAFTSFALLFSCGLGLPLPEDVPLILTGAFLCHDPNGSNWQEWAICGVLNWLGIIGGDICLYWISRTIGLRVTQLPLIRNHITMDRIEKVRGWFITYGIGVVGIGRLIAGVRGAMVVTAGVTKFHFGKFILADGLAAIFSGGIFMLVGWWLGDKLTDANVEHFKNYFIGGAIVLAIGFIAYVIWKRRSHSLKPVPDV